MKQFPLLEDATEILQAVRHRPEINVCLHPGTDLASLLYAISERDTFDCELRRECRGLLVDLMTNEIVLRPYHKFFNVGERPETQLDVLSKACAAGNISAPIKVDGSMIAMGWYRDDLIVATKRTIRKDAFYQQARELVQKMQEAFGPCTLIFERLYAKLDDDAQSILEYPEDKLVLLDVRKNDTGEYIPESVYGTVCAVLGITHQSSGMSMVNKDVFPTFKDLYDAHYNRKYIEGWVLPLNGDFVKFKTAWYINRHHIVGTLCERMIAKLVLNDTIDDALGFLSLRYGKTKVWPQVEAAVAKARVGYAAFLQNIRDLTDRYTDMPAKILAKNLSKKDMFFIAQQRKIDANPDLNHVWIDFYWRHHKTDFSTEILYDIGK